MTTVMAAPAASGGAGSPGMSKDAELKARGEAALKARAWHHTSLDLVYTHPTYADPVCCCPT